MFNLQIVSHVIRVHVKMSDARLELVYEIENGAVVVVVITYMWFHASKNTYKHYTQVLFFSVQYADYRSITLIVEAAYIALIKLFMLLF